MMRYINLRFTYLLTPVLSVTLMYCRQTVGRIKMKLGLGPGHIVLDGDPATLPQRGTAPVFGPCPLWTNG